MITTIPLNKLVPSSRNVRRHSDAIADAELKASIAARGLRPNITCAFILAFPGSLRPQQPAQGQAMKSAYDRFEAVRPILEGGQPRVGAIASAWRCRRDRLQAIKGCRGAPDDPACRLAARHFDD